MHSQVLILMISQYEDTKLGDRFHYLPFQPQIDIYFKKWLWKKAYLTSNLHCVTC